MVKFFELVKKNDVATFVAEFDDMPTELQEEEKRKKDSEGRTLLHAAIENGSGSNLPIINALLARGVPVNFENIMGFTPLHLAILSGRKYIVDSLLSYGASELPAIGKNGDKKYVDYAKFAKDQMSLEPENLEYRAIAALLSVRRDWNNSTAGGFSLSRVIHKFKEIYDSIEPAKNYDKVLVLGSTGCGKSTLLNYLTGTQYVMDDEDDDDIKVKLAKDSKKELFEVGRGMVSATLKPQVEKCDNLPFVYCDLAGMEDSRGDEAKICAVGGLCLLSKLAGDIKNILVVLAIENFKSDRGASFKKTAVVLQNMIKGNPELLDVVSFVITKARKPEKLSAQLVIKKHVSDLWASLDNSRDSLDATDQALLFMLEEMKNREKQIIVANIFDDGDCRSNLEAVLKNAKARPAESFNFFAYDDVSSNLLSGALGKIAEWYVGQQKQMSVRYPELIKNEIQRQQKLTAEVVNLEKNITLKISQMSEEFDVSKLDDDIRAAIHEINEKKRAKEENQRIIEQINLRIREELEPELNSLDTSDPVCFDNIEKGLMDEVYRRNPYLSIFGTIFLSRPRETQISQICLHPVIKTEYNISWVGKLRRVLNKPEHIDDGYFYELNSSPAPNLTRNFNDSANDGKYEELFRASGGLSYLKILFYSQKRHINKARIEQLKQAINDKNEEVASYVKDNNSLDEKVANLQDTIKNCEQEKTNNLDFAKKRKERLEKELNEHRDEIAKIQDKKLTSEKDKAQLLNEKHQIQLELEVSKDILDAIYMITGNLSLDYNENVVEFWKIYYDENYKPGLPDFETKAKAKAAGNISLNDSVQQQSKPARKPSILNWAFGSSSTSSSAPSASSSALEEKEKKQTIWKGLNFKRS